jgi:hypothetical protein
MPSPIGYMLLVLLVLLVLLALLALQSFRFRAALVGVAWARWPRRGWGQGRSWWGPQCAGGLDRDGGQGHAAAHAPHLSIADVLRCHSSAAQGLSSAGKLTL